VNPDDTIVAISTAAGDAARAIVRLSGPEAIALAGRVFAGSDGADIQTLPGFRRVDGIVSFGGGENHISDLSVSSVAVVLPSAAYVFRGPRSFTRQDVVELHIPGSSVAAGALQAALESLGARRAQAGEFTARAFFSGRLDLSAAEAVADVIDAADDAQLRCATAALGGRVARLCADAAGEATDVLALVEASIDFAEEGIELAQPADAGGRLTALAGRLEELAVAAADMPENFRTPHVVMCGLPNAGKSSLLNALAGSERAIVSPIAGTTRDVLSAQIVLEGVGLVTLQDAAGFTADDDTMSQAANAAAQAAVRAADVVLLVGDVQDVLSADYADCRDFKTLLARVRETNPRACTLVLWNKADLLAGGVATGGQAADSRLDVTEACLSALFEDEQTMGNASVLLTSAVTGQGLDELRKELAKRLGLEVSRSGQALGLHRRQKDSFLQAAQAARRGATLLLESTTLADAAELVAIELRDTLAHLGQVSGQAVTEDVLGRIFSRFCVGK